MRIQELGAEKILQWCVTTYLVHWINPFIQCCVQAWDFKFRCEIIIHQKKNKCIENLKQSSNPIQRADFFYDCFVDKTQEKQLTWSDLKDIDLALTLSADVEYNAYRPMDNIISLGICISGMVKQIWWWQIGAT